MLYERKGDKDAKLSKDNYFDKITPYKFLSITTC